MPKPPALDAALAALGEWMCVECNLPLDEDVPEYVDGPGDPCDSCKDARSGLATLRALAAQPERVGVPEEVLALAKQMLSFHDLSAAGSWCSTCQHKWPCPTMTFARFILSQPERAVEPPDAALVASARRKLEHHPDRSGPHGGCSCVDCHAARYILRAAGEEHDA